MVLVQKPIKNIYIGQGVEPSPAFIPRTHHYEAGWNTWDPPKAPPTEEYTITFEYPYDDIYIDYSIKWDYNKVSWLIRVTALLNWTQIYNHETTGSDSWTDWPITVVAGDELMIRYSWQYYSSRTNAWVTADVTVRQPE